MGVSGVPDIRESGPTGYPGYLRDIRDIRNQDQGWGYQVLSLISLIQHSHNGQLFLSWRSGREYLRSGMGLPEGLHSLHVTVVGGWRWRSACSQDWPGARLASHLKHFMHDPR